MAQKNYVEMADTFRNSIVLEQFDVYTERSFLTQFQLYEKDGEVTYETDV